MFDIHIETVKHHGEGQTVCYNCALKGLGTGARCWDTSTYDFIVNYNKVGVICGNCLPFVVRALSREFWVKKVFYNGLLIEPESFNEWFSNHDNEGRVNKNV